MTAKKKPAATSPTFAISAGKGESAIIVNTTLKKIVAECPSWADAEAMAEFLNAESAAGRSVDIEPKPKKKPAKPLSGGAQLMKHYKPMLLRLTPEQHETIRQAAELDGRNMTQLVLFHAMIAAKSILEKQP